MFGVFRLFGTVCSSGRGYGREPPELGGNSNLGLRMLTALRASDGGSWVVGGWWFRWLAGGWPGEGVGRNRGLIGDASSEYIFVSVVP